MRKIIITGAAGLVGQNLVARLKTRGEFEIIGIDKHSANVALFRKIHPEVEIIAADLAKPGAWAKSFADAQCVVINQAQIGGLLEAEFEANNVEATRHVLRAIDEYLVPFFVGISSSVINSTADDFYTRSKTAQEKLFVASKVPNVILRPTLMFGWFDRKHLGWLRRFMDRTPFFPIPDDGGFLRQPLYVGDFAKVIIASIEQQKTGIFDISGRELVTYVELIKTIRSIVKSKARLVHIPYNLFWGLLWVYALFSKSPPFTTSQLEALIIPETFALIDWPQEFGVEATPLRTALKETYLDPIYAPVVLEF